MTKYRYPVTISLVLALNLIALNYLLDATPHHNEAAPLAYQDPLPALTAIDLEGEERDLNRFFADHHGVLLYSASDYSWQTVRYAQVLQERYGTHPRRLRTALVVAGDHRSDAEDLATRLSYPVLLDRNHKIQKALHLSDHANGTFIMDPAGRLKVASSSIIKRDELRQHIEKLILGRILYEPSIFTYLGPSSKMPVYPVRHPQSGEYLSYSAPPNSMIVVLSAGLCATCNPDRYYEKIEILNRIRNMDDKLAEQPFHMLVSASYPIEDVITQVALRNLDIEIYQATDTLHSLENDYFTKKTAQAQVLVVLVDENGFATSIESIDKTLEVFHVS